MPATRRRRRTTTTRGMRSTATSPIRSEAVFVVVGNPACPRVAHFQAAAARCGLPPAALVSYADLIAGRDTLERHVTAGAAVRLESPGRDFDVERLLLAAGADAPDSD